MSNEYTQDQVDQVSGTNIPVRPRPLEPELDVRRTLTLWGGSQHARENDHYMVFSGPATQYTGGMAGVMGQATASLFYFSPTVMDRTRRYVVFRRRVGGAAGHSVSQLREAFADVLGAIASFGLSLLTWDIANGQMAEQPVPMHHIGHIKVVTRVTGTVYSSNAASNFEQSYLVNLTVTDDVYTAIYHDYLGAKRMHDDLYNGLDDVQRRIAFLEGQRTLPWEQRQGGMTRGEIDQELASLNTILAERQNQLNHGTHAYQVLCRARGWDWRHPPADPRRAPAPSG